MGERVFPSPWNYYCILKKGASDSKLSLEVLSGSCSSGWFSTCHGNPTTWQFLAETATCSLAFVPCPFTTIHSKTFFQAGNPPDSAPFSLVNYQKSTFSTCRPVLQASAPAVAPSVTPESDPDQLPPSPFAPRNDGKGQEIRRLINEISLPRSTSSYTSAYSSTESRSSRPLSSYESLYAAFPRRSSPVQPGAIHSQMEMPGQAPLDAAQNGARSLSRQNTTQSMTRIKPRATRTIESRPSVGRTIQLDPQRGINLERALRLLNQECNRNSIRKDQIRQRYHERPGSKRKRLKCEWWRARFNQGFRVMVLKVKAMRRKGW